ncbi:hypothetical protein ADS79_00565 [Brevibacillus reuszeri]|uniref:Uncharacterized protein n=1 Tax=Brevibacillus reuszeri TaxID=54915 RepID=A0A0K9Z317_9BACL|nr:hypothetical protein ADS79_00565 [Brevibacillus reuszeri]
MNEIRRFGEWPEIRIFLCVRKAGNSFFARFHASGIVLAATYLIVGNASGLKKSGIFPVILLDSINSDAFFRISGNLHGGQGSQNKLFFTKPIQEGHSPDPGCSGMEHANNRI